MKKHKKKLIDICSIQYGYAFDSKQFTDVSTDMPLIRIRDVKRGYSDTYYSGDYNELYIVNFGDILIGMDGEFNIAKWKNQKALLNQRVCKVIGNENVVEDYLVYYLSGLLKEIEAKTSFATVKHLSAKVLNSIELTLHEVEEQTKISKILNNTKQIIDNRQKQLLELDDLIKSRFVEMFGDVLINNRSWTMHKWSDVLLIKNGKNQKKVENKNGRYPICGSGGVMSYADDYISNENSVIIGRKGNINNPILMREKYWNVDTAFGLEPIASRINVDYLYMFCIFYDFLKHNKTVTIPSLTKSDLLKIDIPTPPVIIQSEFSQFVQQVDKLKFAVQKSLNDSQILFDALMQEYFG